MFALAALFFQQMRELFIWFNNFCCFVFQIHRDLSGEAAQLMLEYNKIHTSIDTEWMHTYIPECWAAFVPLKAEYYKGK